MITIILEESVARDLIDAIEGKRLFDDVRQQAINGLRNAAGRRAEAAKRAATRERERENLNVVVSRHKSGSRWNVRIFNSGVEDQKFVLDGYHGRMLVRTLERGEPGNYLLGTSDRRVLKSFEARNLSTHRRLTVRGELLAKALPPLTE